MGANISSTNWVTPRCSCCNVVDSGSDEDDNIDVDSEENLPLRGDGNEAATVTGGHQHDESSPQQEEETMRSGERSLSVELPREHDANRNAPCNVAFEPLQQVPEKPDEMSTKGYPQLSMRGVELSQPDAFSESVSPQTTLTSLDSMNSDRTGSLPSGNIIARQVVTASRGSQRLPPRPLRTERIIELAVSPATSMSAGGKGHSSSGSSHPTSSSSKNGSKASLERGGSAVNPLVPLPPEACDAHSDHRDGCCSPSTSSRLPPATLSFSNRNNSRDGSISGLHKSGSGLQRPESTSIRTPSLGFGLPQGDGDAPHDTAYGCNDSPMKREQSLGKTASSPSLQKSQRAVSVGLGNSFVSAMTHNSAAQDPELQPSQWESWGTDYGGGMSPGLRRIKLSTLLDSETIDDV